MTTGTPLWYIEKQERRRRRGKVIAPCVRPFLPELPERRLIWRPLPTTTPYGATGNPAWSLGRHTGEDHAAPIGCHACATTWGRVVCIARWSSPGVIAEHAGSTVRQWGDSYGTHVVIRSRDGRWDYALCHLSEVLVNVGDQVRPGMTVGRTGNTGGDGDFGPHLHLEARPAGGRFGSDVHPLTVKRKAPQ